MGCQNYIRIWIGHAATHAYSWCRPPSTGNRSKSSWSISLGLRILKSGSHGAYQATVAPHPAWRTYVVPGRVTARPDAPSPPLSPPWPSSQSSASCPCSSDSCHPSRSPFARPHPGCRYRSWPRGVRLRADREDLHLSISPIHRSREDRPGKTTITTGS